MKWLPIFLLVGCASVPLHEPPQATVEEAKAEPEPRVIDVPAYLDPPEGYFKIGGDIATIVRYQFLLAGGDFHEEALCGRSNENNEDVWCFWSEKRGFLLHPRIAEGWELDTIIEVTVTKNGVYVRQ